MATLVDNLPGIASILVLAGLCLWLWRRLVRYRRAEYIRRYLFPRAAFVQLQAKHPQLAAKDQQLVARGLRHFFLAHLHSELRFVSMPSQIADDLWHEFILSTRDYQQFCDHAFGRFMHHTPAVVLGNGKENNAGLRRTWWYCCKEENIDPRKPTRLPLLFALDAKLGITGGFTYSLNSGDRKSDQSGGVYYTSEFGSSSVDGTTDGFGDSGGSDGGDGGCGGGCGGGD